MSTGLIFALGCAIVAIVFGIIWMGHLYFFNLVNVPFQGGLDKELKPKVNPALLLRAARGHPLAAIAWAPMLVPLRR